MGGALADRIGGINTLMMVFVVAAIALAGVSMAPTLTSALALFVIAMLALGTGNGAVFQLVPQRFASEIGIMTGLVGMAGGVGGFYLASSLGLAKQFSGSFSSGFLIFAGLAVLALAGMALVKGKWLRKLDQRRAHLSFPRGGALRRPVPTRGFPSMRNSLIVAAGLAAAGPACAQDIALKPLIDTRLRYEAVDQAGLATQTSDAVTARLRAGLQASGGPLSAIVEGEATLALVDGYYDGLHGAATRPLIADPQNIALYRAQIQYRTRAVALTAGRQRITLDDERFVGNVGFRQNAQTFDAVRLEWTGVAKLKLDVSYAWNVRTIWGVDGTGARPRSIGGGNIFGSLSYATPVGALTGFAYLVDQDEAAVQGYRLSSQSYGGRFAGSRALSKAAKLGYVLSYARQSDYRRNPNKLWRQLLACGCHAGREGAQVQCRL